METNTHDYTTIAPWLGPVMEAAKHTNTELRRNGASPLAEAREAIMGDVLRALRAHEREYLTTEEIAVSTGLNVETIRRAVRNGTVDAERKSGRGKMRIARKDVCKLPSCRQRDTFKGYDVQEDARRIALLRSAHNG